MQFVRLHEEEERLTLKESSRGIVVELRKVEFVVDALVACSAVAGRHVAVFLLDSKRWNELDKWPTGITTGITLATCTRHVLDASRLEQGADAG